MQSLREQMLKAGLVTEEQVAKLDSNSQKGRNRRRRRKPTTSPEAKAKPQAEVKKN